mgnify:CR=1 FL=1|tara:strand:- start:479 stop:961 length:483 start_codon:yes stop_codon:yes gene_type:complete
MHFKRNNKESKTYVQGLRSFGSTLPRGVKGILKKNGYNYSEIISKWNILVGTDISSCAYPRSIKMNNGNMNGTLIIAVKRGNEITLEFSKKEIINKVNSYFGYKLINEIRLQSISSQRKKVKVNTMINNYTKKFENKINEIKNTNIKNSLSQLLHVIKND